MVIMMLLKDHHLANAFIKDLPEICHVCHNRIYYLSRLMVKP